MGHPKTPDKGNKGPLKFDTHSVSLTHLLAVFGGPDRMSCVRPAWAACSLKLTIDIFMP